MTINVLYVEGCRDGSVGGSHISLYSLVKNIDNVIIHPIVVFYNNHFIAEKLRNLNIDVYIFKNYAPINLKLMLNRKSPLLNKILILLLPLQKAFNFFWYFFRPSLIYAFFLKKNDINIVHLNNSLNSNHEWMFAAKIARVKLISHERGISENLSFTSKLFGNNADLIICISKQIRNVLIEQGINEKKTIVVYNGIDTLLIRPIVKPEEVKTQLNININDPIIGVVGNIKTWKGQETVVYATAILKNKWPNIRCLFIGDKNYKDPYIFNLEHIIRKLKIEENVIFTGFKENPADFLNIMDIVVHSSIKPEPFGRVNIEAMYMKKPVVSTNIGGPTEIFEDGVDGILIEPSNPILLADKISLLLENIELRKTICQNAYKKVMKKFLITEITEQIEKLYENLLFKNFHLSSD